MLLATGEIKHFDEKEIGDVTPGQTFSGRIGGRKIEGVVLDESRMVSVLEDSMKSKGDKLSFSKFLSDLKKANVVPDDVAKSRQLEDWFLRNKNQIGNQIESGTDFAKRNGLPHEEFTGEVGERIGKGGNKEVFEIKGDTDNVLVTHLDGKPADTIQKELEVWMKGKESDLPMAEFKHMTTFNGKEAFVMPRYATGSKNIIALERNAAKKITGKVLKLEGPDVADSAKFLNQNSIDILKKLRAQMVAQKIHIDDMQFLIKADGTIHLNDLRAITHGIKPSSQNLNIIDTLIDIAQKNL